MAEPPGKSSAPWHFFLLFPEQRRDGRGPGTRLNREAASRQEAMCKEAQQEAVPGSQVTLTPGHALSEERTSRSPRPRLRLAVFPASAIPHQGGGPGEPGEGETAPCGGLPRPRVLGGGGPGRARGAPCTGGPCRPAAAAGRPWERSAVGHPKWRFMRH